MARQQASIKQLGAFAVPAAPAWQSVGLHERHPADRNPPGHDPVRPS
jgi:hypothetical protein